MLNGYHHQMVLLVSVDVCQFSECNHGTCALDASSDDGYRCSCHAGYTGEHCNIGQFY